MSPTIRELIDQNPLPPAELERRERADRRWRERLISHPWYAERDRLDGMEFWRRFQASCVNL